MTAASSAAAALSALAACNLKELHLKRADGSRILDSLHATCRNAGLIPPGTPDGTPKERYLAVFDAALQGGLGVWILDYVEVVCADRHLTSNDPLEAYLLDGGFVKAWAQTRLQRAEQAAESALQVDAAFQVFKERQLLQQLAQMRILVVVLRALDRIRTVAAGGGALPAAASAAPGTAASAAAAAMQDRLSVKAELRQALLLEQAFEVMDWCARQGLADPRVTSAGRFGSYAEWSRAVNARRSRAAPRPLFLDALLQSLSLSGAYPARSVQHMLHTLLLVVRDVDPSTWAAKLGLLSYFLMDAGVLDGPAPATATPADASTAGSGGAGPGPGSGSAAVAAPFGSGAAASAGAAGLGGARLEGALEDLRRTFRLTPGDVATWQCHYLLDCAATDAPHSEDPYLARACSLLPPCVTPNTPFAFIEALLALGRPDVALAVERGQSGAEAAAAVGGAAGGASTSARPCRTLAQAMTLLDIRLRCGLMTEAFMLLRQHTADLAARGEPYGDAVRQHTQALLRHLAEWAADVDTQQAAKAAAAAEGRGGSGAQGGAGAMDVEGGEAAGPGAGAGAGPQSAGGWLNRLTELPLNATEEGVLVAWLAEQAEAGAPAGAFLPLFFLQRGRVSEAAAACHRWLDRQQAISAAAGGRRAGTPEALSDLIQAAVDAAFAAGTPTPLRNVVVPVPGGDLAVPLPAVLASLPTKQGAAGILAGYAVSMSSDQPTAVLPFTNAEPAPLIASVLQPPPQLSAAAVAAAGEVAATAAPLAPEVADAAAGAAGADGAAAPQPAPPPFVAMPLLLPATAPFRPPPGTPGPDGPFPASASGFNLGSFAAGASGAGAGGLLFSVGAGAGSGPAVGGAPGGLFGGLPVAGAAGTAAAAAAASKRYKRSKPNDWL